MYRYGRRDRLAAALLAWVLRNVASERYRKVVGGGIWQGMNDAARRSAGRHAAGAADRGDG